MLILFDFDGTLADTAPDMAVVANRQRSHRGLPSLDLADYRPHASNGVRGMLHVALGMTPAHPEYACTRDAYFEDYAQHMTERVQLFSGIPALLRTLQAHGHAWGIVTNKLARFALPVITFLGLDTACAVTVCGDTTAHTKPHPEPLWHAARLAAYTPEQCIYIGDDARDIAAGHAAGMPAIAAAYGYCDAQSIPTWGADAVARTAHDLWPILQAMLKT